MNSITTAISTHAVVWVLYHAAITPVLIKEVRFGVREIVKVPQNQSITGKSLALHMADLGFILGIT